MPENVTPLPGLTQQLAGRLFKRDLDVQRQQLCLIITQLQRVIAYYRNAPDHEQGSPCPS